MMTKKHVKQYISKNCTYDPNWHKSSCPDQSKWLPKHLENHKGTIVSVGCNKGYDFIQVMRKMSNNPIYSNEALKITHNITNFDGACKSGSKRDVPVNMLDISNVRGFCIEPMINNYKLLKSSFEKLNLKNIEVTHAAVGSIPGFVNFPVGGVGAEGIGINHLDSKGEVPVITLDQYAELHNIDTIEWLSIDTEGNDARVLIGATNLLYHKKIKAFEFEAHDVNHWKKSNLEDLIDLLHNFGYTCHWETEMGNLVQITGCWITEYEKHPWKNVACFINQ